MFALEILKLVKAAARTGPAHSGYPRYLLQYPKPEVLPHTQAWNIRGIPATSSSTPLQYSNCSENPASSHRTSVAASHPRTHGHEGHLCWQQGLVGHPVSACLGNDSPTQMAFSGLAPCPPELYCRGRTGQARGS